MTADSRSHPSRSEENRLPTRSHVSPELRRWLFAWLFFTTVGCLWAAATPVLGVPDEPAHTVYAAGAVRGEIWEETEGPITRVTVPAGWANVDAVPACYAFQPNTPAGCAPALTGAPGTAEVATSAGRYPPLYYFYTGLPTLVVDGAKAVYLMRGLTAALVGALLASAVCSLLSLRRRLLPLLGFALASTPMLFFFAGAVNPQAPEIAAAICLWSAGGVALLRLAQDPQEDLSWANRHLRRAIAAVAVLTVIRPLSLLWLALIVVTLVLLLAPRELPRLARSRAVLTALPVLVLTAGSTLVWIVLRDALGQQDVTAFADLSGRQALLRSVSKLDDEFGHMIGHFGWLDSPAPGWATVVHPLALGALAALALPLLTRVQRLAVAGVAVAVLVLPVLAEVTSYRESAFAWQGRYTLPIAVGVPILLGLLPRAGRPRPAGADITTAARPGHAAAVVAAVVSVHVVSFVGALNRNVHGIDGFWAITPPGWSPPVPSLLLVAVFGVVAAAGGWFGWRWATSEGPGVEPVAATGDGDRSGDGDRPGADAGDGGWASTPAAPLPTAGAGRRS